MTSSSSLPVRGPAVLAAPRLLMRRLGTGDAAFVVALLNDPAWIAHIGDRGVRDAEGALAWMLRGPEALFATHGFGLMACEVRDAPTPIGICGLVRRPGLEDVDVGYALLPEYRGQGYATEAVLATLAWARDVHALDRVVAIVSPGNAESVRVLGRCGFAHERDVQMPGDDRPVRLYMRPLRGPRAPAIETQTGP